MTNFPWYPEQPGNRLHANHIAGQEHRGDPTEGSYRSPYDWRYARKRSVPPHDPYRTVHQPFSGPTVMQSQKRSRGRIVVIGGAVAVAVVTGGIGAAAVASQQDHSAATGRRSGGASRPASGKPARRLCRAGCRQSDAQCGQAADRRGPSERRGLRHRAHLGWADPDEQSRCGRRHRRRGRPGGLHGWW